MNTFIPNTLQHLRFVEFEPKQSDLTLRPIAAWLVQGNAGRDGVGEVDMWTTPIPAGGCIREDVEGYIRFAVYNVLNHDWWLPSGIHAGNGLDSLLAYFRRELEE